MTNANNVYFGYQGSDTRYQHPLGFIYTPGVKALAEECECYWLLDVIASHQTSEKVKAQRFQVWHLERIQESKFLVLATDGNDTVIAKQIIPFSDFKYDKCMVWLVDRCMLLPSEY